MILSQSQKEVFDALLATASVFFDSAWVGFPVRPRFSRLITGPTGTGKSFLVRHLAAELDVPILELTASSWLPVGATERAVRSTWVDIRDFIESHPKGILFIDELDKITGGSTWMQYIRVEMFYLLDRRIPDPVVNQMGKGGVNSKESGDNQICLIRKRLDQSMLVIGAGSFQDLRESRDHRITGFVRDDDNDRSNLTRNEMAGVIPREIVNRFAGPVLYLPPLRKEDYRSLLSSVCDRLSPTLAPILRTLGAKTIDDAVTSQIGYRWIEELLLRAMIERYHFNDPAGALPGHEREGLSGGASGLITPLIS